MLVIPAHAKVNLCLAVLGRRPDGFHDVDSVALLIDWHDLVGVTVRQAPATAVRVTVTGPGRDAAPGGAANLAAMAMEAVARAVGSIEAAVWLDKRIPVLAGLGGGSADAAAVLRACAAAARDGALGRRAPLDPATLRALAESLGSDVPLALGGGMQRLRGRGEQLDPVEGPMLHLAVAVAAPSDTTLTYAACQAHDHEDSSRVDRVVAALRAGRRPDDDDLGSGLEAPACRAQPVLDERLTALRAAIPEVGWHLTGSGGAVFTLAADAAGAAELAAAARHHGFPARACRAIAGAA
jgi:4-diphosphocytidyl-2-C-methyl-D-erythritol kinase